MGTLLVAFLCVYVSYASLKAFVADILNRSLGKAMAQMNVTLAYLRYVCDIGFPVNQTNTHILLLTLDSAYFNALQSCEEYVRQACDKLATCAESIKASFPRMALYCPALPFALGVCCGVAHLHRLPDKLNDSLRIGFYSAICERQESAGRINVTSLVDVLGGVCSQLVNIS
jgi:hypothetical protein